MHEQKPNQTSLLRVFVFLQFEDFPIYIVWEKKFILFALLNLAKIK